MKVNAAVVWPEPDTRRGRIFSLYILFVVVVRRFFFETGVVVTLGYRILPVFDYVALPASESAHGNSVERLREQTIEECPRCSQAHRAHQTESQTVLRVAVSIISSVS